jgi:hypothetical protein
MGCQPVIAQRKRHNEGSSGIQAVPMSLQHQRRIALGVIGGAIALTFLSHPPQWLTGLGRGILALRPGTQAAVPAPETLDLPAQFLVVAGGGAPSYNEIALEKNVLYFRRTLEFLGLDPNRASLFFANGNDGQATIRYLDPQGQERFKVPAIPNLTGASTRANTQQWLETYPTTAAGQQGCPAFFYFTGHSSLNPRDDDNNGLIMWGEEILSVQGLGRLLDQWPVEIPFVTMMAQCYGGAFANLIYEGGDPTQPVALQTRCGFFATVKERPSVGCTPLVDESDYRDYSSSFFAGLSGRDRVGNPAPSADYDGDGTITYREAHAFAKIDGETPDWPISTSEAWLQRQATARDARRWLRQPLNTWLDAARPEQRQVIVNLSQQLGYTLDRPLAEQSPPTAGWQGDAQIGIAYHMRIRMEVINVAVEQRLRARGNDQAIAILDRLLACEASHW